MTKHKPIKLNMRPMLLDELIFAYLYGNAPSRASVSEGCKVSKVTSGKVAKALVQSKIMCEKTFSLDGAPPCAHLFIDDGLNVMLVDLSSEVFRLIISDANARIEFQFTHAYDSSVSFDDNINIFLSRGGLKVKQSGFSYSAISVIYADGRKCTSVQGDGTQAILPSVSDRQRIGGSIYSIFHKHVIDHLTVSDAISKAMKFGIVPTTRASGGVSYVFLGSGLSSFHVYENGSITVTAPEIILSDDENRLLEGHRAITKDDADSIFIHLATFMVSAFSPSGIILESDCVLPDDETAQRLNHALALKGIAPPAVYFKDTDEPLYLLGAIRSSVYSLAKRYIQP